MKDSRSDHHHVAVGHRAHTDQEVGQRHPELEPANGALAVVETVEQDRVLGVTLTIQGETIGCRLITT